jgi:hypothetical protein
VLRLYISYEQLKLKQRQHNLQNKNTIDNEKKAERLFKQYLTGSGEDLRLSVKIQNPWQTLKNTISLILSTLKG